MEKSLIPPDKKCCQAIRLVGFMQFGPPKETRCTAKPVVIAIENKPGKGHRRGSMSLCAACKEIFLGYKGTDYASFTDL